MLITHAVCLNVTLDSCMAAVASPHLALQAEAEVLIARHRGLVHADAQAAVTGWKGRRHDLLQADHLPEQVEVAHLPRELPTADTNSN